MNVLGTTIQFSNNGDSLDKFINITELKDKKESITEADFKKSVMKELTEPKANALIEAIKKDAPEFFKK